MLIGTAPGSGEQAQQVFDRAWTVDDATAELHESYQWRIDGVDFELAVQGSQLVRTMGRCARPAVTLMATKSALADLVTGRRSVNEAVEEGHLELKGSKAAIRRMFEVIGFPLVRLGF
jgi:alkyl sulfatase BDS1-like metallo-beta-lactamase superfamily hydrolase